MKKKCVVGVCAANIQRSPTFEAVLNYELDQKNIFMNTKLEISSAGLYVEKILTNNAPINIQIRIIAEGLNNKVVPKNYIKKALYFTSIDDPNSLDKKSRAVLKLLYQKIQLLVFGSHISIRNHALQMAHIPEKYFPTPLIPYRVRSKYNLVLSMDKNIMQKVSKLYEGDSIVGIHKNTKIVTKEQPKYFIIPNIITYGNFIGVDDLPDRPSSGLEGAIEQVEYFMDTRKRAISLISEIVL